MGSYLRRSIVVFVHEPCWGWGIPPVRCRARLRQPSTVAGCQRLASFQLRAGRQRVQATVLYFPRPYMPRPYRSSSIPALESMYVYHPERYLDPLGLWCVALFS